MKTKNTALELRDEMLDALEAGLRKTVSVLDGPPHGAMADMVYYHLGWTEGETRGKRLRPLLTLLVCDAAGGAWRSALPAAVSVELIHNFSLIHDDIEDGSETRRGRPTLWKEWGLPQALNTGDALLILSHAAGQRLLDRAVKATTTLEVLQALDAACLRLTIGQHLDLAFEDQAEVSEEAYLTMIGGKTSSLLATATAVGAQIAEADPSRVQMYREFGHHLGMAFQIQDDVLGIWGEPSKTGKPTGDDLRARKKTLPVIHGIEHSAEFRALWTRGEADGEALVAMREALETVGSLEHARELASSHTDRALEQLRQAEPGGEAGAELERLAAELLGRER